MVLQKYIGLAALIVLAGVSLPGPAQANVPLTRADVDALLNRVELIPRGRPARAAQLSDYLGLGDALRTAAASRAELRFNDGSLARVGERATFRFTPNTRNFRLSNGTVLFLIPPGQGRTTIQTPNATTGIQGSAVVVRHIAGQDLTLVMALTNNPAGPMTITTQDGGASSALYAGQMALVRPFSIEVVEFDLAAFYQTSDLVEGLGLDSQSELGDADDPLAAVRAETLQALAEQMPFSSQNAVLAPDFIRTDSPLPAVVDAASSPLSSEGSPEQLSDLDRYSDLPPGLMVPVGENEAAIAAPPALPTVEAGARPAVAGPVETPAVGVETSVSDPAALPAVIGTPAEVNSVGITESNLTPAPAGLCAAGAIAPGDAGVTAGVTYVPCS
jgi:FecR protein